MAEIEEPSGEANPRAAGDRPEAAPSSAHAVVRTLLLCDLVDSTKQIDEAGDRRAAEIMQRHDRVARSLLGEHDGHEVDKTDGFFHLFELPSDAVCYALAYHQALAELSAELGVELSARVGIHLGGIQTWENSPADVAQGAKPVEVEGQAKQVAARLMSLASGRQPLLTSTAFSLAKRSAEGESFAREWQWVSHEPYRFKGIPEPVEIFEVGIRDSGPFTAPVGSAKAKPASPSARPAVTPTAGSRWRAVSWKRRGPRKRSTALPSTRARLPLPFGSSATSSARRRHTRPRGGTPPCSRPRVAARRPGRAEFRARHLPRHPLWPPGAMPTREVAKDAHRGRAAKRPPNPERARRANDDRPRESRCRRPPRRDTLRPPPSPSGCPKPPGRPTLRSRVREDRPLRRRGRRG